MIKRHLYELLLLSTLVLWSCADESARQVESPQSTLDASTTVEREDDPIDGGVFDLDTTLDTHFDARTEETGVVSDLYPKDQQLRLNQLQGLGTHNSYHLAPALDFLPWSYDHRPLPEQLEFQGVRQFELDIFEQDDGTFKVLHILSADDRSNCDTLRICLTDLKRWSDLNLAHHAILLLIEPKLTKSEPRVVVEAINEILGDTWGEDRLVTPRLLQGEYDSIKTRIITEGWPTLGATRGRLIPILHTSGALRDANLSLMGTPVGTFMVSDAYGNTDVEYSAFHSVNDPVANQARIHELASSNQLVRTRADSDCQETVSLDYTRANAALMSGAHFISTDFPRPAMPDIYGFIIPEGTPSRCNPVSAPSDCRARDIESL